jgi:hypothetical protein
MEALLFFGQGRELVVLVERIDEAVGDELTDKL